MNLDHLRNLITGGLSGLVVDLVLFPLDNLKTKSQSKNTFSIYKINTLYSGITPTLIGSIPSSAIFYCFYELTKQKLIGENEKETKNHVYLISTCIAETASCIVRLPFEILKQNMQVYNINFQNLLYYFYQKNNLNIFLLKSFIINLLREIPFDFIQFYLWENFNKKIQNNYSNIYNEYSAFISTLSGGLAGGISGFITTPVDVIKTRQMIYGKSFKNTIKELKYEGLFSFFKGCHYRTIYLFFGGLLFFGSLNFFTLSLKKMGLKEIKYKDVEIKKEKDNKI